jgi:probable phosphoglycerate mutase
MDSPAHKSPPAGQEASLPVQRAILIRHGDTAWTVGGRHTGTTDIPLTENGRAAARRLAPLAAMMNFSLVLTSPLRRARETCELAGLGHLAQVEAALVEWNYGEYEGLTREHIQERAPGWNLFTDGCPGGESPAEVAARADRVIESFRGVAGDIAIFAHGHFFRVFAARWLRLSPAFGAHLLLDPATVSVLSHYRNLPVMQRWNAPVTFLPQQ